MVKIPRLRRTQEGFSIVISFSVLEARIQLLENGVVYTFRWKQRKQVGKDWANEKRGGKKIADVFIEEVAKFMPNMHPLIDYYKESGFSHWWMWFNKIMELKPKNHGPDGWLYKVTLDSQQLGTRDSKGEQTK